MSKHKALLVLLVIQIALGTMFIVFTPLWQGHEQDFYHVTRFIVDNKRFPTQSDYPNGDAEIRQATQPPLFFVVAYPIVRLFDNNEPAPYGSNPLLLCPGGDAANGNFVNYITTPAYDTPYQGTIAAAYIIRFINLIFAAAAVFCTYHAARKLFPTHPGAALMAAALLALEPNSLRFVTVINNDALLLWVSGAMLYVSATLLASPGIRPITLVWIIVLAVAAPLTKLTGWVNTFALLGLLGLKALSLKNGRTIALAAGGAIILLIIGVGVFNTLQYGSPLGRYTAFNSLLASLIGHAQIPPVIVQSVLADTQHSILAPLLDLHPRQAFVNVYSLLLLMETVGSLISVIYALLKRDFKLFASLVFMLGIVLINLVFVVFRNTLSASLANTTTYNTALIFAPLRYYAPALPAAAILLCSIATVSVRLPGRIAKQFLLLPGTVSALAFGIVSIAGAVNMGLTYPRATLMSPQTLSGVAGLQSVTDAAGADLPQLRGYQVTAHPDQGFIDIDLYASVSQPTGLNFAGQVTLTAQGERHSFCQFLPARGMYSTLRWPVDEIVVSQARIPNCAGVLEAPVSVNLQWLGYDSDGLLTVSSPSISLGQVDSEFQDAHDCPNNLGIIGDRFQLVKWNSPTTVHIGEVYLPSANWLMLNDSSASARYYEFVHQVTGETYLCVGSPSDEVHPITSWRMGETVYFDACSMQFLDGASTGVYSVYVGVRDQNGADIPARLPDDSTANRILVGTINVEH